MAVNVETEKLIVHNVLKHLFKESYADMILSSLYCSNKGNPIFLSVSREIEEKERSNSSQCPINSIQPSILSQQQSTHLEIKVENFLFSHYAKLPFPKFSVRLIYNQKQLSSHISEPISMVYTQAQNIRVRFSIRNRWADVSSEVLNNRSRIKRLINGEIEIEDFSINEVSVKHGGFFIICIEALLAEGQDLFITPWYSKEITINSERTWAKRKKTQQQSSPVVQSNESIQRLRKIEKDKSNKKEKTQTQTPTPQSFQKLEQLALTTQQQHQERQEQEQQKQQQKHKQQQQQQQNQEKEKEEEEQEEEEEEEENQQHQQLTHLFQESNILDGFTWPNSEEHMTDIFQDFSHQNKNNQDNDDYIDVDEIDSEDDFQ